MTQTVTITLRIPEGVTVDVDYGQEPPHPAAAPRPTSTASAATQANTVPQCPHHGPMAFHEAGWNKAHTKELSASYRCDEKLGDDFCPTKPVWLKG